MKPDFHEHSIEPKMTQFVFTLLSFEHDHSRNLAFLVSNHVRYYSPYLDCDATMNCLTTQIRRLGHPNQYHTQS